MGLSFARKWWRRKRIFRLAAGGSLLDDAVVLDVIGVVGLNIDGKAVERALESVLGRRVHHAGLRDNLLAPLYMIHWETQGAALLACS